ncbi:hypothetical protein ABT297_28295 [Dactylosporangium sp. NPDC000555]|uniref:hypothetical protein n=1 Tax=Dactylosporangium sp. NPDC000555 TaxID=3154260 RepID=UPI0033216CE6
MFERFIAEARQVVALVPYDDVVAGRPVGNTAGIWTPPQPPESAETASTQGGHLLLKGAVPVR